FRLMNQRRRFPPKVATISLTFLIGIAAGIYLQHRWPLGKMRERWMRPPPIRQSVALDDIRSIAAERRLVLVIAGQSNAANHGQVRTAGGQGVYAFFNNEI